MALINCPECGKEISERALACPNCGCPIANVEKKEEQIVEKIVVESQPQKASVQKPMYVFTCDHEKKKLGIECSGCGKVYQYDMDMFPKITNDTCVSNKNIVCPTCGNVAYAGHSISSKTVMSNSSTNTKTSLRSCPSCKKTISSEAFSCPHCGQPLKSESGGSGIGIGGIVTAIIIAFLLISIG